MKKMIKKTIATVLCVIMLLGIAPLNGFVGLEFPDINIPKLNIHLPKFRLPDLSGIFDSRVSAVSSDNLTYSISNGEVTITGCTGSVSGELIIPDTIAEKPVTAIGVSAFKGCIGLTSVTIPGCVKHIYSFAFENCTGLTNVTIQNGVTSISNDVFHSCTGLTGITIPASVTSLDASAFACCTGLASITVDENNTYYDSRNNCNAVIETGASRLVVGCKNTVIPDTVTIIGDNAFYGCSGLTNITIPFGVTDIESFAFFECTGLSEITLPNSVANINYAAFQGCAGLTSLTIPGGVTNLSDDAFAGCPNLASVTVDADNPVYDSRDNCNAIIETSSDTLIIGCKNTVIPSSVTSIGGGAFAGCTTLTSITIPGNVTSLGDFNIFYGCDNLASITVDADNPVYDSRDNCNAVVETSTNTLIAGCKNTVIPESVTVVGSGAFVGCTTLTEITIPGNVTTIGSSAFDNCTGLTDVTISEGVTEIGSYAFIYCSNLASVSLPDSLTSIEDAAFGECYSLTSITIPSGVEHIGSYAFCNCPALASMSVDSNNPVYDSRNNCNAIIETSSDTLIIGCKNTVIPNTVTIIGSNAFSGCTRLSNVTIGNSVTSIGDGAFSSCTGLTSLIIPNTVTSIGGYAFNGCSGLTNLEFEEGSRITNLEGGTFSYSPNLKCIVLPSSITSVSSYWITNPSNNSEPFTSKLTVLYSGSANLNANNSLKINVYKYYDDCFAYSDAEHTNLVYCRPECANPVIPGSVTTIADDAFNDSAFFNDESNWENGVLYLSDFILKVKENITGSCAIKPGTTAISNNAFKDCTGLTGVTIPESVTTIGNYAFSGCTGLTSINYNAANVSALSYSSNAFKNAGRSAEGITVTFGSTVQTIPNYLFYVLDSENNSRCIPNLKTVIIGNNVTSIGQNAFSYCSSMTSLTIGNSVTIINDATFSNCSGLTSVTIPNSVTNIDNRAFYRCQGLTSVTIGNSVTTIGSSAFENCTSLTSITIPCSVTSIGSYTFEYCSNLANVEFEEGSQLTTLKNGVFSYCPNLLCIELPASITSAGFNCFGWEETIEDEEGYYYTQLTTNTIVLYSGSANLNDSSYYYGNGIGSLGAKQIYKYYDENYAYSDSAHTKIVYCRPSCTNPVIPDSVLVVYGADVFCDSAYYRDESNWENGVLYFSGYLVKAKENITGSYAVKPGTRGILRNAFENCTGLTGITISNSVTFISYAAFYGCTGLESITIPASVTNIGSSVFSRCTGLTDIIVPDSVTSIGSSAFSGCSNLTSVTIGNSVTSIGSSAFSGCINLTEINFNAANANDLTSSSNVFYNAGTSGEGITVTFGNTVQTIPANLFNVSSSAYRPNIKTVTIGNSVATIGSYAFFGCNSLSRVEISDLEAWCNIGFENGTSNPICYAHHLYLNNSEITDLIIPDTVTGICNYAFYNCTGLTSITIPVSVTSIGSYAFNNCNGLVDVTIPAYVTTIGDYAFYECTGLTDITVPDSVTSIGSYAFSGCSNLTSVTIGNSVVTIGIRAFSGCINLTEINFNAANANDLTNTSNVFFNAGTSGEGIAVTYGNSVQAIPANLFYVSSSNYRPNIKTVIIGNSVTSIGDSAFKDFTGLTSITIPGFVTTIGSSAFENCSSLTSITIPASVTSIGSSAFSGCVNLTEINYNAANANDLTNSSNVFYNAGTSGEGITVTIGNTVQTIPANLFYVSSSVYRPNIKTVIIGNSVTSIGDSAFKDFTGLTSITIPGSVITIGSSAFENCTSLTSITIPASVTAIGNRAFFGCTGLAEINYNAVNANDLTNSSNVFYNAGTSGEGVTVTIGNTVQTIPAYLFHAYVSNYHPNIKTVTFGNNVTSIGNGAFIGCTGLTDITIPDSVTSIGYSAFQGCTGLTSVTIPNSVTTIGSSAFSGCNSLSRVEISDLEAWCNIDFDNDTSNPIYYAHHLYLNNSEITDLVVPYSVTTVKNYAFCNCSGLTSLNIGNSVTSIGYYAFYGCDGLTSIDIPHSVTSIDGYAFSDCDGLTYVLIPNSITSLGTAFSYCDNLFYVEFEENSQLTYIGNNSFSYCPTLKCVELPTGVSNVYGCFQRDSYTNKIIVLYSGSANLTNNNSYITVYKYFDDSFAYSDAGHTNLVYCRPDCANPVIPGSVVTIAADSFIDSAYYRDASNWEDGVLYLDGYLIKAKETLSGNYTVKPGTIRILGKAFYNCTGLTGITVPDSVDGIDSYAFYNCTVLSDMVIPASVTKINDYTFYNCCNLSDITIPDSVTSIGNYAFYGCAGLTNVTIGNSVSYIGNSAFSGCTGLTNITTGNSVSYIGSSAFSGCTGLTSITIPSSVSSIGYNAFCNCTGLTEINYNAINASNLGSSSDVFYNAGNSGNGITVTFGESVRTVPAYLFYVSDSAHRPNIRAVTIGNNVTTIGGYAFDYCAGITSLTMGSSVTIIGSYAFFGCNGLTSLTLPDTLTRIGDSAFSNCYGLTEINIPSSVSSIGDWAFSGCSGLTEIEIPQKVTSIGRYTFNNCTGLTTVTIPRKVTSIGNYAFDNCSSLTDIYYSWDPGHWNNVSIGSNNSPLINAVNYEFFDGTYDHAWIHFSSMITITFDTQGGSSVNNIVGVMGDTVEMPEDPVKPGYTFAGWVPAIPSTIPDDDLTVTATWSVNQYTISFNTDGAGEMEPVTVDYGTPVTMIIVPGNIIKPGYTFIGWDRELPFTMPAENLTLTAQWQINTHYIVFNTSGGDAIERIPVQFGSRIPELPVPVRTGYTFTGWSGTIPATMPDTDIFLTAAWSINRYTITFDTDGGTSISPIVQNYNTTIAIPPSPSKPGHTFVGWNRTIPTRMPAENLTIKALWSLNTHNIIFNTSGGDSLEPMTLDYGSIIPDLPVPAKTGYTFIGWSESIPATMPDEDITLTALWTVNQYTITFDTCGGTLIEPVTADYGTALITPDNPSKAGYNFIGWDKEIPATMPAENLTLTAVWEIKTYSIFFNTKGGDPIEPVSLAYGSAITGLPVPVRMGYTFFGWKETVPATMPDEDITLTARWAINEYTVTFDTDGGTEIEPITADFGTTLITPDNPSKVGYTFIGWDKEIPATMPAENLTVKALWSINSHDIIFNSFGGDGINSITLEYGAPITDLPVPEREGYTFIGWSETIPETMPDEDLILTALWSVNQYTITFNSDGGSEIGTVTADYGTVITIPESPSKEGYSFVGWDAQIPKTMPAYNLTFTAIWNINTYTITFNSAGGSTVSEVSLVYNSEITVPEGPVREGYTFIGWDREIPATMPACNMTVTARWSINTYNVTFNTFGGSNIGSRSYTYGYTVYNPSTPSKTGYIFEGWIWPTENGEKPGTMPAYNMTVSALWKKSTSCGHTTELLNTAYPTCTENGFSGYTYCETCEKIYDNGYIIPSFGHDYVSKITSAPSCTETGIRSSICNKCGNSIDEIIEATGHSRTSEERTLEPTCTEDGINTVTCHCGYSWNEPISANGHRFRHNVVLPPACEVEGIIGHTCNVCGYYYESSVKATEHEVITINATAATCETDGNTEGRYCSLCGKVFTESVVVPASGHTYQNYVLSEASCNDSGKYIKICSRCNCVETGDGSAPVQQSIVLDPSTYPVSSHNYSNNMSKDYTFSYPGASKLVLKFSSNCRLESGYDYLYIYDGSGEYVGSYSGSQLADATITITGESFRMHLSSDGSVTYYGFSFDSITALLFDNVTAKIYEQPALGHDYEEITVKESTCQENGKYVKKCSRCGEYAKDDVPVYESIIADSSTYPETPHNYENSQEYNYSFTYPNAKEMTLAFSSECRFENGYDFLNLYDGNNNLIGRYTDVELQNREITVNGESFSITVTTDNTVNYYGFSLDSITVQADTSVKKFDKPKSAHDFIETVAQPATPLETGLLTCICKVCGYSETRVIPKTIYAVGEIVSYGSYPQSKVIDKNLLNQLNAQPATWRAYNYYSGNGYNSNGSMSPSDYMMYADVVYQGEKYRAVSFLLYRPAKTGGIAATLGNNSLQDDYGYFNNRVYWFKYEPLKWRILDPTLGLVISDKSIDSQAFSNFVLNYSNNYYGDSSHNYYANNWANSSIRDWLNNDFLETAFTVEQRSNVLSTNLNNLNYSTLTGANKESPYDCETTTDKVFLLSYDDVLNTDYGFSNNRSASDIRVAYNTDYARCQGIGERSEEKSGWFLRTSANRSDRALIVGTDGSIETDFADDNSFVGSATTGIRPALRLSNISATGGSSSSGQIYTVTYQLNGNTFGQISIAQNDPIVLLHAAPPTGYVFSGWNAPEQMPGEDITLTGEYLPVFKATFVADGETVGEVDYTTASTAIIEPPIPEKDGYIGYWEDYSFTPGGITINAVYESDACAHVDSDKNGRCDQCDELIRYTATFVVEGSAVFSQEYTVETTSLNEPVIPPEPNKFARWQSYNLKKGGNIEIYAIYDSPKIIAPSQKTLYVDETYWIVTSGNFKAVRYEWRSDNKAVATVDNHGLVTATGLGTASVTVTRYGEDAFGNEVSATSSTIIKVTKEKVRAAGFSEWLRMFVNRFFNEILIDFLTNINRFGLL